MDLERFCDGLISKPQPSIGTVLVTGATGYVGGRLVPELLARGYHVRVLVRAAAPGEEARWPGAEVVVGDASDRAALNSALRGVHAAYYLIHSLLIGSRDFEAMESVNARNFRQAAEENGVQRIIYLGGLGDVRTFLSPHLRSRMRVAEELQSSVTVATTVLRAAIIIGSGSASYEIVHHLVKRMPIMLLPPWTRTRCQPIGIRDVVRYLVGVLESPETAGGSFDIGGTDVLTYEDMMRILAN
ncbi:MAG: NAD(P)H-binding protein, partial [bacterium]